jgi:hypothetical protein
VKIRSGTATRQKTEYKMDEAVREVLPKYGDTGICRRVGFMKGDGKEAVYKSLRLASVSLMAS